MTLTFFISGGLGFGKELGEEEMRFCQSDVRAKAMCVDEGAHIDRGYLAYIKAWFYRAV